MKKILLSILCACVFMVTAHATLRMPDITVTKITTTGVNTNVGFKVKDSNEWLKADAEGKWTVTSTDTPVQGAIGEKDYSGFFFQPENSYSGSTSTPYYHFTYTLADINDPANGIVVDPTTTGGSLLAPRRAAGVVSTDYFLIEASTSNTTLYVLIYNGKVYGTADMTKATKFEAYQLAYADHDAECVQEAEPATCEEGGVKAKYHCTICDKYFREEACTNETSSEIEEIPALGHEYQVDKDEQDNASWIWVNVYSKAILHVCCSRSNCYATDDQTVATTSEVTTQPTTESEGVLTFTAKATYNEVEYTGTKTETLEKTTALAANTQLTDGSWTLYNADAGSNMAEITVTPGTSSSPTVANILLQSTSETPITVQTRIMATEYTTVNIHTIGNVAAIIKGDLTANQYGTININGASVSGTISGKGTFKLDDADVAGYLDLSYGADVTINGGSVDASSCEAPAIIANNADVNISGGSFKAKEGKSAFLKSGTGNITAAEGKTFWHDGVAYNDPFAAITPNNAPARSAGPRKAPSVETYNSQFSSYTVGDANHTVHTYGANGMCTVCEAQVPANMTLDDTTDPTSTLQGLIAANAAQNITLTGRTLYKDGAYNTLCLPFALTAEQLAADNCPLKGCTLMEVTGASLNTETNVMTIQLTEATALEAGKPYLIKWESGTDIVSPTFTGVTITKSEPSTISGDNLDVVGIFAPQTMKESDTNLFFLGAENKFYTSNVEAGANLKGYRCYFKAKNNNAKALNFVLDDDETTSINNEQLTVNNEAGAKKHIENGCVVIIRNGKKYNVNGQIIK